MLGGFERLSKLKESATALVKNAQDQVRSPPRAAALRLEPRLHSAEAGAETTVLAARRARHLPAARCLPLVPSR
jgi:hypothetical protein